MVDRIGTTLKCKWKKKKGNGLPDKHKARGAARGDQLVAKILKAGLPMPQTFSPTVKPLTFAFMMQIRGSYGARQTSRQHISTFRVQRAILTKLEPFVADICGLDPNQLYRTPMFIWVAELW